MVPSRWISVGLALWLLRPAYVVVELVVAAATTGGYSLVDDSVSRLGNLGCSAEYCSPRHDLMNAAFVGFGTLLALGAVLLASRLGRVVTVLLVVAGLSSVATGLAPLDQGTTLHAWAATPLFVAQPLALLLLARRARPGAARTVLAAVGVVVAVAAAAFVLVGSATGAGALERLALWPVLVALPLAVRSLEPRGPVAAGGHPV